VIENINIGQNPNPEKSFDSEFIVEPKSLKMMSNLAQKGSYISNNG